jgi:hypothetical protein
MKYRYVLETHKMANYKETFIEFILISLLIFKKALYGNVLEIYFL